MHEAYPCFYVSNIPGWIHPRRAHYIYSWPGNLHNILLHLLHPAA